MKNKVKEIVGSVMISASMFMAAAIPVYGADNKIIDAAKKGGDSVLGTLQGLLPYLVPVIIAILGLVLIIGGERGKEDSKQKAPQIIIGIICVVMAGAITTTMIAWFK